MDWLSPLRIAAVWKPALRVILATADFHHVWAEGGVSASQVELPEAIGAVERSVILTGRFLSTFFLGVPDGIPCFSIAAVTAALAGVVGHQLRSAPVRWAPLALTAAEVVLHATWSEFSLNAATVSAWLAMLAIASMATWMTGSVRSRALGHGGPTAPATY